MNEHIQAIKISRGASTVIQLLYADDLMITCRAIKRNAEEAAKCLCTYYKWSGEEINKEKSSIIFLRNTNGTTKREIKLIFGVQDIGLAARTSPKSMEN